MNIMIGFMLLLAPPPPVTVTASVDCAVFSVAVENQGDALVIISEGSQPPMAYPGHPVSMAVGAFEREHAFWATVEVGGVRLFEKFVECSKPLDPPSLSVATVSDTPEPVAVRTEPSVMRLHSPW